MASVMGVENVTSGTAQDTLVPSGATSSIGAGATLAGTADTFAGGTLVDSDPLAGGANSVVTLGTGATVTITGPSGTYAPEFSGYDTGDIIDLTQVPPSSVTAETINGNELTIWTTNGDFLLNIPGMSTGDDGLVSDGHGGSMLNHTATTTPVCFDGGTMVATPDGERAVETLAAGDVVSTLDSPNPITWTGHRSIDVSTLARHDDGRLVRVRRDAFADGVPHRDLLVTPEHCVLWAGGLVPVRMLVNNKSIVIDRTINAFTYNDVELERHGILLAESLTRESYLDTGNRGNSAKPSRLPCGRTCR